MNAILNSLHIYIFIRCLQCQHVTKYTHPSEIPKDFTLMTVLQKLQEQASSSSPQPSKALKGVLRGAASETDISISDAARRRRVKCENVDEECTRNVEI
jgi:hypothetical protein